MSTAAAIPTIDDQGQVCALLLAAGLPLDGLDDHWETTRILTRGDDVVGSVTVEPYGRSALLRSLVVAETCRGEGIGARLVAEACALAARAGAREIYLLTGDAQRWFAAHGFTETSREEAPTELARSTQWTLDGCRRATLMAAPLSPSRAGDRG